MQKLQNRAARIVTNSTYDAPANALMQKLKRPNVAEIIKQETATIVYKSLIGLAPTYLSNIFSKNSSRGIFKLINSETDSRIPLFKTSNGQKLFSYRGIHLWSSLEPGGKQALSVYAFRTLFSVSDVNAKLLSSVSDVNAKLRSFKRPLRSS